MNKHNSNYDEAETKLSYDLRQRRAKVIGDCLDAVVYSSKAGGFYIWFRNIQDLYDISEHAFNEKDDVQAEYKKLSGKVIKLANANKVAWLGNGNDAKAAAEIESALRELFRYLMRQIQDSGIFGKGYVYDEDEI